MSGATNGLCPPCLPFGWNQLAMEGEPLDLVATLRSGQAFRWREDTEGVWWGTIEQTGVALWQVQNSPESSLFWQTFPEPNNLALIHNYFRLEVNLSELYVQWCQAEPRIATAIQQFRGLRILLQPPEECFFAFQCATCNTVHKIERSVHLLAQRYGENIPLTFALPDAMKLFTFPKVKAIANASESVLRGDLWGYRAPRVIELASRILNKPDGWLRNLRQSTYAEAKVELVALPGIGEKIADCIALFCLDKDNATPVDTHIRQIAVNLFRHDLVGKSLTPRIYAEIANAYSERFGKFAGWAQQYLFCANRQSPLH